MHKTLIKIFAVLIIPVFLFACEEENAGGVSKDELSKALSTSVSTSKELDGMLLKAYALAKLGDDMAATKPEEAMMKYEEAFSIARQAHTPKYRNIYKSLSEETANWPKEAKDQVSTAINSIDLSTSRVWLARVIAEGMYSINPDRANEVANWAVNQAGGISNSWYRDLDLRGLSAYYAGKNLSNADNVAMRIDDLRVKTYAYRTIADTAMASGDSTLALEAYRRSADLAKTITSVDAEVPPGTYAESASQPVKDEVQQFENAKQQAYAARTLASIAVTTKKLDSATAMSMLNDAVSMADAISDDFPYTKSYAISDIAGDYATVDTNAAAEMLNKLGSKEATAKATGIIKVAKVKAEYNLAGVVSDITPLSHIVEDIEEPYERDMMLRTIGGMIAPASPDNAKALAADIELPDIKNELLIDVAKAWASDNIDEAKKVIEEVPGAGEHGEGGNSFFNVYEHAPANSLYQKAVAYKAMADEIKGSNPEAAMKLYTKANGYASDAGSAQMQWQLADEMCKLDHSKFMSYAAKLQPADPKSQTMILIDIASDWSDKGDPYAGMVWDEALKAAGTSMDNFEASCLLGKVGVACSASFPDKSAAAFVMSAERCEKIGAE